MGETLGVIHPGAKFLSICGLVKLENKLPAPKIQLWDRHRITAVDIPISKGREWKEKRVTSPKQF